MPDPVLTKGTLYINQDRDFRTGEIGPYVKIGVVRGDRAATDRGQEHQTGNPREIITLHEFSSPMVHHLEGQLHNRFARYWVHGEWFEMNSEFIEANVLPEAKKIITEQLESVADFEAKIIQKKLESSGVVRTATEIEKEIAIKCFAAREEMLKAMALKDFIDYQIRILVAENNGIENMVTMTYKQGPTSFDKSSLIRDNELLAKEYFEEREPKLSGSIILNKQKSLKDLNEIANTKIKQLKSDVPKFSWDSKDKNPLKRDETSMILHAMYVHSLKDVAITEWEFERQKARLVNLLGTDKGIENIITYNRELKPQEPAFNSKKFKSDHPELYETYLKQGKKSVALTIESYRAYPPIEIDFSEYIKTIYD